MSFLVKQKAPRPLEILGKTGGGASRIARREDYHFVQSAKNSAVSDTIRSKSPPASSTDRYKATI